MQTTTPLIEGIPHSGGDDYWAKPVLITPELAAIWLDRHNTGNRTLSEARVVEYAEHIAAGSWRSDGNTISFDTNGRLINGQHRLHAVVRTDIATTMLVAVNADPLGFATTDTGRNRTARDILSVIDPEGRYHSEMGSLARFIYNFENNTLQVNTKIDHVSTIEVFERRGEEMRRSCEAAGRAYGYVKGSKLALAAAFWRISSIDAAASYEFYRVWTEAIGMKQNDPAWNLIRIWRNGGTRENAVVRAAWIVKGYNQWVLDEKKAFLVWRKNEEFPTPVKRLV